MPLPTRTTVQDAQKLCSFLIRKPNGAHLDEAKGIVGEKLTEPRRVHALRYWGLLEPTEPLKVTALGRRFAVNENGSGKSALGESLHSVKEYAAVLERAGHQDMASMTASDVTAHWRAFFREETSASDEIANEQAITFFQFIQAAGLGQMIIGRRGAPTRFVFDRDALQAFLAGEKPPAPVPQHQQRPVDHGASRPILVLHGADREASARVERLLEQFRIPHRVALAQGEPGAPIDGSVREALESCGAAIVVLTRADQDRDAVLIALGAATYVYATRVVVLSEEDTHPERGVEVFQRLIALGIVRLVV
ncbi:MAG TPA: hypothetical protein VGF69_15205 [Thermoanaerobaculia bacterium]